MDLIAKVRQLWAAKAPLVALVPMDKVHTGSAEKGENPSVPYVEMSEGSTQPYLRTSTSNYRNIALRIQIWTNSYTTGRRIRDILLSPGFLIDRDFALEDGTVIDLTLDNGNVIEETDDPGNTVFQFILEFTASIVTSRSSSGA